MCFGRVFPSPHGFNSGAMLERVADRPSIRDPPGVQERRGPAGHPPRRPRTRSRGDDGPPGRESPRTGPRYRPAAGGKPRRVRVQRSRTDPTGRRPPQRPSPSNQCPSPSNQCSSPQNQCSSPSNRRSRAGSSTTTHQRTSRFGWRRSTCSSRALPVGKSSPQRLHRWWRSCGMDSTTSRTGKALASPHSPLEKACSSANTSSRSWRASATRSAYAQSTSLYSSRVDSRRLPVPW